MLKTEAGSHGAAGGQRCPGRFEALGFLCKAFKKNYIIGVFLCFSYVFSSFVFFGSGVFWGFPVFPLIF